MHPSELEEIRTVLAALKRERARKGSLQVVGLLVLMYALTSVCLWSAGLEAATALRWGAGPHLLLMLAAFLGRATDVHRMDRLAASLDKCAASLDDLRASREG